MSPRNIPPPSPRRILVGESTFNPLGGAEQDRRFWRAILRARGGSRRARRSRLVFRVVLVGVLLCFLLQVVLAFV